MKNLFMYKDAHYGTESIVELIATLPMDGLVYYSVFDVKTGKVFHTRASELTKILKEL